MDDNRMVESITDWKPMEKMAKKKSRKRWMDNLLDGMKIMRITNWMRNIRNKEVWHKLLKKAKIQRVGKLLEEEDNVTKDQYEHERV